MSTMFPIFLKATYNCLLFNHRRLHTNYPNLSSLLIVTSSLLSPYNLTSSIKTTPLFYSIYAVFAPNYNIQKNLHFLT